jgi:Ser/Thr protein kinase RdoA (MazF antagonist)
LLASDRIPTAQRRRFEVAAESLIELVDDWLGGVAMHRIHGDFHLGNLIERDEVLHALDFDDALTGPAVQDLWMLLPGRDVDSVRRRDLFIEAYEQFRPFDRTTLRLIEPLRGLRLVHFCGWLAARWHDPIFPQTWPQFTTDEFWEETTSALEEVIELAWADPAPTPSATREDDAMEAEATNADFFWDWEG